LLIPLTIIGVGIFSIKAYRNLVSKKPRLIRLT